MVYLDALGAYLSNRTPHPLHLYIGDDIVVIPVHGEPIRLPEKRLDGGGLISTVHLMPADLPAPAWLPAPENDNCSGQEPFLPAATPGHPVVDASGAYEYAPVLHIVSLPVAQHAARMGRADFVAPDTGSGAVRDADGKIVGVRGFVRYAIG
jgi:hypothetical protein